MTDTFCNYNPSFSAYIIPYKTGGQRPWQYIPQWENYNPIATKICHSVGFQAYNIIEGDLVIWEIWKDDVWQNISTVLEIPNNKANWSFEESSMPIPLQEFSEKIRMTVKRNGCLDKIIVRLVKTIGVTKTIGNKRLATSWNLYVNNVLMNEVSYTDNITYPIGNIGIDLTLPPPSVEYAERPKIPWIQDDLSALEEILWEMDTAEIKEIWR